MEESDESLRQTLPDIRTGKGLVGRRSRDDHVLPS